METVSRLLVRSFIPVFLVTCALEEPRIATADEPVVKKTFGWFHRPKVRLSNSDLNANDINIESLVEGLKWADAEDRLALWKRVQEKIPPEKFASHLSSVSLSDDPDVRDSALNFLWQNGDDGALAAAISYAIRCRLAVAHQAWLVKQIEPRDKLSLAYLELFSRHESPRVLQEVGLAQARLRISNQAVAEKLTEIVDQGTDLNLRLQAAEALLEIKQGDRELKSHLDEICRVIRSQQLQKDFVEVIDALRSCIEEEKILRQKTRLQAVQYLKEQQPQMKEQTD